MLMNANCLDVLVALSNIARNECYPAYEHVLESQLWLLVLPFHGSKVICERAFEVFKRIAPPQSEAQALAMYEYKKLDQIPVIGKIWKDAADTFLIVHGRTEIATATASPRPTSGPSKKSSKRL